MANGYGNMIPRSITQSSGYTAPVMPKLSGYNQQAFNMFGGYQPSYTSSMLGSTHPVLNSSMYGYNVPATQNFANPNVTQDPLYGTPLNKGYNPFQQGIL